MKKQDTGGYLHFTSGKTWFLVLTTKQNVVDVALPSLYNET